MPLFPLGTIGLNSSESEQTIARASVGAWGDHLNWRTLDSARQFAAAARIGFNGSKTLAALVSVLAPPDDGYIMFPSGYISDGDCVGLENSGMIAVVNEWCLQSHEGAIRVFDTIPSGHDVKFHNLVAEGGFLVSAAISAAGEMHNFTVALPPPPAGRHVVPAVCRCFVPRRWAGLGAMVVLDSTGSMVPHKIAPGGRAISFAVRADGGQYIIMPARHR
jgi:hypothetical protein